MMAAEDKKAAEDHAEQTRREAASDIVEGTVRPRSGHGTPPAKPMVADDPVVHDRLPEQTARAKPEPEMPTRRRGDTT
jgi:hypothetical protein